MKEHLQHTKKAIFYLVGMAILSFGIGITNSNAQALTGTVTVPGTYSTIKMAIDSLNAYGVGTGGVTINVAAGHTETLTAGLVITATGTLANPIVFQKSGVGNNPVITAFSGSLLASSTTAIDVMWAFEGSDYITVDGINLSDTSSNTTNTTMMEVGYGLYKIDGTDGANNNTIQNCTVTLNRDNITGSAAGPRSSAAGSVAIELVNATRLNTSTAITVTTLSGSSSYNKFYGNTLQNCNFGILLSGFAAASPFTFADMANDIGGSSLLTGNNIINFGGGTGAAAACGAVLINNQWSFNISYNTINNNNGSGINHPVTNRGVWLFSSSIGASCDITNNKITISAGVATGSIAWCLDLEMAQSGANGNTININNNQFLNCNQTAASTVAFTAVWLNTAATTVNVNNNYFYGWSYSGTGTTQVILSQFACGTLNILNNTIDSTVLTGATATGTHYNIGITTAPTVALNINNNTITRTILSTAGAGSKTLYGIYYTGATPSNNFIGNTVNDINRIGTTGGTTIGIIQAGGTNGTSTTTVRRNTISNISIDGTGTGSIMYGIQVGTGTIIVDSNEVFNLTCTKTTGTGTLYGIYNIASSNNERYNNNTVYNLTHNGTGIVYGIYIFTTTGVRTISYNTIYNLLGNGTMAGINNSSSVPSIFNNKIYDLTTNNTAALILSGIAFSSSTAGNVRVYNNLISNLNTPSSNGGTTETVRGINIASTTASVTYSILYNTINLNATSSGTNFSTTGVFHTYNATATTATLDLRNNIIVNTSTPNGTGRSSVIRRSAATNLNNFSTLSNRNLLFAGTPSATKLIFNDGTNFDQTLANYVARVTPRDTNSVTENPTFLSTVGSSPQFLQLDSTVATYSEATARNISGITTDFANTIRAGNANYTGVGGAPDMGAWEANNVGQPINQMVFDSANTTQRNGLIAVGSIHNPIVRVEVFGTNGYNALEATSFKVNTASSTSVLDITNAKIYYTGGDSNFATTQLFGTTTSPASSFYVTGSQRLAIGVNYFWVTYDISNSATPANFVDAAVDSILLSGVNQAPLISDPAGNRQIAARLNGNYNIGVGQNYTSLTSAFAELNLLGVSGPVTFTLKDIAYDSITSTEVFPIVLGVYVGSSSVNTVTILPDLGIAATIAASHSAAFELNGGDNYIFDGRQGGVGSFVPGNSLVISNSNGPAIKLLNDAQSNKITYCDLRSNNAVAAGTVDAGVVYFGTTNGANGNDSNQIKYCDIHDAGANLLSVGISSIGSATTVATNNDNNIVDSNNIYDYCNASNATAAVHIGANNSTWQINGNHFYQTVPRTFTGASHRVLWITPNTANLTSASGFTITNNFIGGNAADGTGLYDIDGNNAAFVFATMDISVGLGAATSIQNNTITNILDSTTSTAANAFVGINMVNGNVNCGTIAGNMIGSRVTNGSILFTAMSPTIGGLMGFRTGGGTGNTFNISNNIVSGITLDAGSATTSPEFMGLNLFNATNVNATNNMVGDTSLPNSIHILSTSLSSVSAQRVAGFFVNPSGGTPNFNISNNTIANITNSYSATGTHAASTKGIAFTPTITGTYIVNNNTIKNIRTASSTTGSGINSTLIGIGISQSVGTVSATGNVVHSLTLTSASIVDAVRTTGIFFASATSGTNVLARNFTHSKSLVATNPFGVITGIELGTGNGIIVNNMVREGYDSNGAVITTACSIRGIVKGAGSNQVYFNTIFIGGSNVGVDNSQTFAFLRTGAGTDMVNNNIFYNQRSNSSSGAGHFAVGLNNNTTLTMNYNLLKADTIGVFGVTSYLSIPNWKAASSVDANSISNPLSFLNAVGDKNSVNLHLDTAVATPTEAYGTVVAAIGTDVDFDGQTRSSLTPVDLGAHAGNFIPSDIAAPSITYTALTNTIATGDRTLTATIIDATGVYVSGAFRPRVYFKKMFAGSWNSDVGMLTSGTAANGTWTFTINALTMGGLVGDDSVYYYVVAQDSTAFNTLGSFPGGVEGTDVNSISVTPNPSSYKITPIISGTLLVGAGQPYTTLTATNGLFNYLNSAVIGGNLTVQITSDIEEPGTVGLNETVETGLGGYTINIVPDAAVVRNLTGNYTVFGQCLIRLNGADRVKIDGSFGGSGRFLRLMNRSAAGSTFAFQQDADNDTLANCIIEGTSTSVASICFLTSTKVGGTGNDSNAVIGCLISDTLGTVSNLAMPNTGLFSQSALSNDFNTVDNNEFVNIGYGAFNMSTTAGTFWTLTNNKIYQTLARNVDIKHFQIDGGSGYTITGNSIGGSAADRTGPAMTTTLTFVGIYINTNVVSALPISISNNSISNIATTSTLEGIRTLAVVAASTSISITNNYISNITPTTGASFGMNLLGGTVTVSNNTLDSMTTGTTNGAIHFGGGAGTSATIENNSIANLRYTGTGTLRTAGISVSTTTATSILIRNNTIRNISGDNLGTATTSVRLGGIVVISAPLTGLVISDNTISNIRSTNLGTAAYAPVGIHVTGTTASYSILRNRISNIVTLGTGVGAAAPIAMGIQLASSSTNCTVANNQISIGDSALNESRVMALSDYSSGANTFAYNSVFVNGTTAAGGNHTYGFYRNTATSNVNFRNNIVYNKRTTLGSGFNYAVGAASATLISGANINYNLFVVNDTNKLAELPTGTANGWSQLNALYTTSPNTNWATDAVTVTADLLFTDTATGNLGIITTNPQAWYANGKGRAMATISGDYTTATGVRSTTIATGSTDIGSIEFTPSSIPPVAQADTVPTLGDSTVYTFASRRIAQLNWDVLGTVPTSVDVRYYSGVNPANTIPGSSFLNAYYDVQPTGGSGFNYALTLMHDSAIMGNITSLTNLQVARYRSSATNWINYTTSTVDTVRGFFANNFMISDSMGVFTGTDGVTNPLPVTLTSFTVLAKAKDANLTWTTASETNNKGFDIERSVDGKSFEKIAFVKGAGNSNVKMNYALTDAKAFVVANSTILYYRLKQVDLNGTATYSKIVKVSITAENVNTVLAYPNPFTTDYSVSFTAAKAGVANMELVTILGSTVSSVTTDIAAGNNVLQVNNVATLETGIYFVKLTVNGETQVIKLVKN